MTRLIVNVPRHHRLHYVEGARLARVAAWRKIAGEMVVIDALKSPRPDDISGRRQAAPKETGAIRASKRAGAPASARPLSRLSRRILAEDKTFSIAHAGIIVFSIRRSITFHAGSPNSPQEPPSQKGRRINAQPPSGPRGENVCFGPRPPPPTPGGARRAGESATHAQREAPAPGRAAPSVAPR